MVAPHRVVAGCWPLPIRALIRRDTPYTHARCVQSARNGDLATCLLDPNQYYDDTSLLGHFWPVTAAGLMSFSIAQSRLVAKFLTDILGQRNNVTPCPKDCAGVPLFRACGSGLRSIALRLHSPCVLHLSSRVLPLTRNRPRTRCEPVECRWTPSSFGEPMFGLDVVGVWLVNWTQQVGRDHGFGLFPCPWPNGRQLSVIRCDGSLRRNRGRSLQRLPLRRGPSEGTPSTAPRFV